MPRFTRQSLIWSLGALICIYVCAQTWLSVQWLFTSIRDSVPPSSTYSPENHIRYEREYTTLIASAGLIVGLYVALAFSRQWLKRTSLTNASANASSLATDDLPATKETSTAAPYDMSPQPQPLSLPAWFIWLRQIWCYEYRPFATTIQAGQGVILLTFVGIHIGLIVGIPLASSSQDDPFFHHQLVSNRVAQMALVDLSVAVGLSVRTSIVWRWLGLSDLRSTITWHWWFAMAGYVGVLYHACFQWTKHYYRHYLEKQSLILVASATDLGNPLDGAMFASMTWWRLVISNHHYFTGFLMSICMAALWVSAHPIVRTYAYSVFRAVHVGAFVGLALVSFWHHWVLAYFYISVLGLWLVDVITRCRDPLVEVIGLDIVAPQLVQLQIFEPVHKNTGRPCRPSGFYPGQFAYFGFSRHRLFDLVWSQPFSISRVVKLSPGHNDDTMPGLSGQPSVISLYIKVSGKRTQQLYDMVSKNSKDAWPSVRLGTPLGQPLAMWDRFESFPVIVLVAEGIGITPWLSVVQAMSQQQQPTCVYVIWTVRDSSSVRAMVQDTDLQHAQWRVHITSDYASIPSRSPDQLDAIDYHHGRPLYTKLLNDIRLKHPKVNVLLGLCAHDDTIATCGNLARSSKFSHPHAFWKVKTERFEFL
ncbi:hypothetical protein DM01DRAFT_1120621 [Hesseltinella vesiculosa]|uniref:Uncharacterized protein n=1 Tax=Hesseltinella vesiculosa TaxID=101127 RepID=A0A1X2GTL6_9FUNG|nr:hypothetical protein DM01DRAFT_1120621 [Hesseltinella vesiculosa]